MSLLSEEFDVFGNRIGFENPSIDLGIIKSFSFQTQNAVPDTVNPSYSQVFDDNEEKETRARIFTQDNIPGLDFKEGDIWFDTDDNDHIYVANSALQWVSRRDGTIATAAGTANWSEVVDDDANKPDDNADVTDTNEILKNKDTIAPMFESVDGWQKALGSGDGAITPFVGKVVLTPGTTIGQITRMAIENKADFDKNPFLQMIASFDSDATTDVILCCGTLNPFSLFNDARFGFKWIKELSKLYSFHIKSANTIGGSTTQFDITNTAGNTYRYTWDGNGTDPDIANNVSVGTMVKTNGQNFNASNNGTFNVTAIGVNYFEVTNAAGVAENDVTIGTGSIQVDTVTEITNATPGAEHLYKAIMSGNGDTIKFYLDGILVATHSSADAQIDSDYPVSLAIKLVSADGNAFTIVKSLIYYQDF